MVSLNFSYVDSSLHSVVRPSAMSDPVSPTYTSYSVPSPFSSGSSASYPNHSPVSEPFDVVTDSDHYHNPNTMEDYTAGYAPPSSSQAVYNDHGYITPQDFEYNMVNWSASELVMTRKRQPPPPPPPQQFQQHPPYRSVPSQGLPNEVERMKNLALYIPPTSPTTLHHQQQPSPVVIHSPVPVVPSNVPPHHSPSLANHPPHDSAQQIQHVHVQPQFLTVDVESEWRTGPRTAHHAQYPPTYAHSHSHSVSMGQSYPPVHGDPSQAPIVRRTVSDYSPHVSSNGFRIKQEDMDMYSGQGGPYGGQHTHSPHHAHIFNLPAAPKQSVPSQSALVQAPPLSPTYYTHPQPDHHQQQHQQHTYAIHPAELSSVEPHPAFDASPAGAGYNTEVAYEQARYANDPGYVEVCDPQFVGSVEVSEKVELVDSGRGSDLDDGWDARRRRLEAGYAEAATEAAGEQLDQAVMADEQADADTDADADGEDDPEGSYSHSGYAPPPHHQPTDATPQRGGSPDSHEEPQIQPEKVQQDEDEDEDDHDNEDPESEDDDARDPEFVLRRPRRHTFASYPYTEGRNLRSTRYNPYPSYSSASPTGRYPDEYQSQSQNQYPSQHLRPRRSYSHTSLSLSASDHCDPLSPGTNMHRRRSRPSATLPIPVPIPNLTKKSRGRRVPTMEDFQGEESAEPPAKPVGSKKKGAAAAAAKGMRTYTCDVDGCGKLFARGEHLKRHIRSIHTYEKPHRCPYPGCGKDFSRHDNLGQHMRVHKDYVPAKDGQNGYKA